MAGESKVQSTGSLTGSSSRSGLRRSLSRTQSSANRNKTFIKYAKLGDDKSMLSMLRSSRAQPDWEHEGESALVAASSKAQIKCVNELIKAGADCNQRDSNGTITNYILALGPRSGPTGTSKGRAAAL